MLEDEVAKIASDIKVASDNTIKNGLINFDVDFSGLKDVVALFFPSIRNEMILRYRAETIAKIGIEAYRMAISEGIQINPIPPKIALPLIEKMSLEHEPDMYEKWAKLLIAAGVKPNPIHQQYADILSNLNCKSASFLKEIYTKQGDDEYESKFDEYIDKSRFQDLYKEAERRAKKRNDGVGEYSRGILSYMTFHNNFYFPLFISGTEEKIISTKVFKVIGNSPPIQGEREGTFLVLTKEESNMLLGLEKLGLIRYKEFETVREKIKGEEYIYVKQYGVLLTKFGHSFVDCLEHSTKE
jgi:hypothetical protein